MKKEYYIQAANSVKEMAIASKKRQTNIEKEAQALFFWILKHLENEIKYATYWSREKKYYCLEIQNYRILDNNFHTEQLLCSADIYRSLFVTNKDFAKVIKRVVNIFNSIKGYKAEYFDFAKYRDTIIRITLNIKDMEEK